MGNNIKTIGNILLLLLLFATGAQAQNSNRLSIPDLTGVGGSEITLPVNMDNTGANIVAVEFNISVSGGVLTLNAEDVSLSERCADHEVVARQTGGNACKVMIYSPTNQPFKANSGELFNIRATVSNNADATAEYEIALSDVIISDSEGNNVSTGADNGTFRISPSTDFTVTGITVNKTAALPGDTISVSWTVNNTGVMASTGGWSERLSLTSPETGEEVVIGTLHNDGQTLAAGGSVSRSADIALNTLLGIEGGVNIKVAIAPNSDAGEDVTYQHNNTSVTDGTPLNIGKRLYMTLPAVIEEGSSEAFRCTLSRSGSWSESQTFSINKTAGDQRLAVPEQVVIPQGQSSAYFYLNVADNDQHDSDSVFTLQASGNGYDNVDARLVIEDNEYPQLTLTASESEINEGETFKLTVAVEQAPAKDMAVNLTAEYPKRFTYPQTVTIPAGETSATADVTAIDNDELEVQASVAFRAVADKYIDGECIILLNDNDMPTIEMELSPTSISESAGATAILAKIRRTTNIDKKTTIVLSDDSDGDIYYPTKEITMEAGTEEAQFSLGAIDNADADGSRKVNITAAVYVSSCNCAATGTSIGVVTKTIEIIDDDGPALSLNAQKPALLEGDESGNTITVSRNTDTTNALSVNITSDYDDGLSYEHNVTIPAGAKSVDITVKAVSNDTQGDDRTIVFTAEAQDYAKGTCWMMLTDQTLPDAAISSISVSQTEVNVGGSVNVTVNVTNTGVAELPELTPIGIYVEGYSDPAEAAYLQQALPADGNTTITKTITLPATVGRHNIYAVANDGQKAKELLYVNNTSEKTAVATVAPYSVNAATDKQIYSQGEEVTISGQVDGTVEDGTEVEVYVINSGYRHTINVKADAQGGFSTIYKPYAGQMGHFSVGACYPSENSTVEQASFDIYGMKRTSTKAVTCETLAGETFNGKLQMANPGTLPLTGVKVSVTSKPDNCNVEVSCPGNVAGGEYFDIDYAITSPSASTGNEWEQIHLQIESAEGARASAILYYYCRNAGGKLAADVARINTTMNIQTGRDYPIVITNIGKGETGKITLSLPSWMTTATPSEMQSLAYGDSATIVLRMNPTGDMQLNVPVTGQIGINCANGDGLPIAFTVEPVSEVTGTLVVDVCDEYTYYTADAPHVSGAEVVVKHPTTGAVITQGLTDENGQFTTTLPEGYYALSVTADRHDSYRNNILVDPGKETKKTVNLSFQAITIDWNVEETEIEDEYTIETTVEYETNVPKPVVTITGPEKVDGDAMREGESVLLNYTLTNKGLIEAKDVEIFVPDANDEWSFTILDNAEPFNLSAQQSKTVPILLTKLSNGENQTSRKLTKAAPTNSYLYSCMAGMSYHYKSHCGTELKDNAAAFRLALKACTYGAVMDAIVQAFAGLGGGGGLGLPNGGGGGSYYKDEIYYPEVKIENTICDPDVAACGEAIIDALAGSLPGFGNIHSVNSTAIQIADDYARKGKISSGGIISLAQLFTPPLLDIYENTLPEYRRIGMGNLANHAGNLYNILTACNGISKRNAPQRRMDEKESNSWMEVFNSKAVRYYDQIIALNNALFEIFGDNVWYDDFDESKKAFFTYLNTLSDDEPLTINTLREHKPESVSTEQLEKFIARINNSYVGSTDENKVNVDNLIKQTTIVSELEEEAVNEGYKSLADLFDHAYEEVIEDFNEASSNVCSSITLQFSQTMTMTRQAFRGTLTVFNGNEEKPMENVRLNLEVRDDEGTLATSHEFQINAESLDGFTGELNLTDGWSLAANETGTATILFIPTKYAALEADKAYSFGGSLTYVDPFTDLEVTRDLYPVTLTVKPSPELDLTYFMQRDVYGDDPLTADVVEASEPAEFALLINNKGYGDATDVRMVTEQPEIVENEKGLLVDFELISSQLNGQDATLALGGSIATKFGTIPAKSQAYAQWWLQSSLLGHFTDYDVKATHVTSYGNEDLSLLDNVTIHELIRGFTADGNGERTVRAFLVNDIVDAEDLPDMVYFTDGRQEESVTQASSAKMQRISDTEYKITVTPSTGGWTYGSTNDLTAGRQKLVSVTRESDGITLPTDNFWTTDRTLRDGKDPLYEYRMHFAVNTAGEETYILTFEPRPSVELAVEKFDGIPEDGTVLTKQLETVTVTFNKPIQASTFTTDDISLDCQGKEVDKTTVIITPVNESEYKISFGKATAESGYYVLTVQTEGITDAEGYNGSTGKSASWTQYVDGMVTLKLTAQPEEGGTVSPADGKVKYGEATILKATPAEGYEFVEWTRDGETISTEPSFEYIATADDELTAVFTLKHFNVNISYDPTMGYVENAANGIYEYGTVLKLTAIPYEGYVFNGWLAGDKALGKDARYELTVKEDIDLTAKFIEDIPTGIGDRTLHGISISPLPLENTMFINGDFYIVKQLFITDLNGAVRISENNIPKGTAVDLTSLPRGIYIIRIVTDNRTSSIKAFKE